MKNQIISTILSQLKSVSTEQNRLAGERYFKEEINLFGVKAKDVQMISKNVYREISILPKKEIFDICDSLWQLGYIESGFVASDWSYNCRKKFAEEDIEVFERWIALYVNNWASCDSFCNHTVGEFVQMYPNTVNRMKIWAKSDNRWLRRAAAVSLIIPARKGKFLNDIFEIADILLLDKDDMVQKGYGWMLKSASQYYQQQVYEYVLKNRAIMPRTSLRYAIEKMPETLKKEAMKK
ncbi:MAG TPA: DNA alkylation repair protein [Bacteroidales bacterium]|nr:DNA alkylation repair protein [Bacteroidales bacterium]